MSTSKFGSPTPVFVTNNEVQDNTSTIGTASLTSASGSAVSLIPTGGSGVFNNIASLTITNESSTATVVSLADGAGNTYKFALAANGGITFNPAIPLPQGGSGNTAWTVLNSGAVSLDYVAIYFSEQVSA